MRPSILPVLFVLVGTVPAFADDVPAASEQTPEVTAALRALKIVQKGASNYPKHRQCFSCHHQTLPLMAMDEARQAGLPIDEEIFRQQTEFTHRSFEERTEALESGEGIGGRSLTVSYGLWALDVAARKPDATTTAMVRYLLKNQEADGRFTRQSSLRPPMSESTVTTTVLSTAFLKKYADEAQREQAADAAKRAREWLAQAKLETQEDYALRLWGWKLLEGTPEQIAAARQEVLARQRADGGWAAAEGLESDAYATGQALFVLHETGLPAASPEFARGAKFLCDTQQPDGSWLVETRAKPVQIFFDNDDPHGKHQFISISATAWAAAALVARD